MTNEISFFILVVLGASSFSGYVETWCAFVIGCVVGILSCALLALVKKHSSVCVRENSVDISFIFGVPAILGSIAGRWGIFQYLEKPSHYNHIDYHHRYHQYDYDHHHHITTIIITTTVITMFMTIVCSSSPYMFVIVS